MKPKIWLLGLCAVLFGPLMAQHASAQTCSGSFGTVNLGSYTGASARTSTTAGSITCASGFAYQIGLSRGSGAGATVTQRVMTGPGGATLNYQIFQDSPRSQNWGNTSGVDTRAVTGSGQGVTLYTSLPDAPQVRPGTYTDTITVSVFNTSPLSTFTVPMVLTVPASCTLSATSLAFGNYTGALKDTNATLTATCTNTTPYNIGLSAGLASGATVTTRAMKGPSSALLNYAVFRDAARTLNLGNTIGTDTVSGAGTGSAAFITIYGRIAAGRNVRPGSYADTLVATISY